MTNLIDKMLSEKSQAHIFVICVFLILLVGAVDYLTGYEISVFIFYALPIWIATWYGGRKAGLLFAILSLVSWSVANVLTGHVYSHPLIPYWNGMIRLGFFLFTAFALDDMKAKLKLEELNADFDSLTSILNGRGFRERAGIFFPLIKRDKAPYAIAFIDVDNFKQVNDTKGHAEGDFILKKVAEIMRNSLRSSDLTGRLGGDEFVIMLPRTDTVQAENVVSGLKNKLDSIAKDSGWPIGFSIGVGVFDSTETEIDEGIKKSDALMYEVKKSGKGRATVKSFISTRNGEKSGVSAA